MLSWTCDSSCKFVKYISLRILCNNSSKLPIQRFDLTISWIMLMKIDQGKYLITSHTHKCFIVSTTVIVKANP